MDASELYDSDFVLWTEQQAAALRRLAGVSNSLDVSHLAEEIEDLGKRDVREVESLIRLIMEHLLKVVHSPNVEPRRHWRFEIINFQDDARNAFTNSMRRKIDVDRLWRVAVKAIAEHDSVGMLSGHVLLAEAKLRGSPLSIDELLAEEFDLNAAIAKIPSPDSPAPL